MENWRVETGPEHLRKWEGMEIGSIILSTRSLVTTPLPLGS